MPATDQNSVYVAVVIAILGFMIGFAKGGFGGLGGTAHTDFVVGTASGIGCWSAAADVDDWRRICRLHVLD